MKTHRGTYVHRGDVMRRRARLKQTILALSFFAAVAFVMGSRSPGAAEAVAAAAPFRIDLATDRSLTAQLDAARGELALTQSQLDRANDIIGFSSQCNIDAELAGSIIDVARAEGIDPDLAFRLVKLESDFNENATSPVGAIGLTQVMLPTARFFDRTITAQRLYSPETNLRIGFRYLRTLIEEHDGNVKLALLVYNRGPAAVARSRALGTNPSNGYDRILFKGYRGSGVVD